MRFSTQPINSLTHEAWRYLPISPQVNTTTGYYVRVLLLISIITKKLWDFGGAEGGAEDEGEPREVEELGGVEDGHVGGPVPDHDPVVQDEEGTEEQPDGDVPTRGDQHAPK